MTPKPIQRCRVRGHKHPPGTLFVDRSNKTFGNPWHVVKITQRSYRVWRIFPNSDYVFSDFIGSDAHDQAARFAVKRYDEYLADIERREPARYAAMMERVLAAEYIACFCPVREPDDCCHRSVLGRRAGEYKTGSCVSPPPVVQ